MKLGFITVAAAIPSVRVGDTSYNISETIRMVGVAEKNDVEIVCFPELGVTGYSCQDLFRSRSLLDASESALSQLLEATEKRDIVVIVGMPIEANHALLNCAVVVQGGRIRGIVPKTYLPNYGEFYEKRWFVSSRCVNDRLISLCGQQVLLTGAPQVFTIPGGACFGIEVCEDVWAPQPPSSHLSIAGADLIFNLSASDDLIGKHQYLKSLLAQQSARTISGYVYASCGYGESTQDVVYGGNALIYENGVLLAESQRFSISSGLCLAQLDIERLKVERRANTTFACSQGEAETKYISLDPIQRDTTPLTRDFNPLPFIPKDVDMAASCEEILSIQTMGLARRIDHTHVKTVVIGISGGLDSTLALLVAVRAFDKLGKNRKGIIGVTMPGFGTTDRTHDNAISLMQSLGVSMREISISASVKQHFADIGQDLSVHDVTYENGQARERTQILMDLANKENGLVVGTGDLSELALGWATYNGDHISMYGVNAGVPKTLIKHLVNYVAMTGVDEKSHATLLDIMDTPISPELIPADDRGNIRQKTEDLVGPYELHDFFLYYYLRFGFRPSKIYMMALAAFDGSHPEAGCYDSKTIKHWLTVFFRRFFTQQFKRSCLPDGPKVGSVSLSPRGDWRMPTDASAELWLHECDIL